MNLFNKNKKFMTDKFTKNYYICNKFVNLLLHFIFEWASKYLLALFLCLEKK